MQYIEQNTIYGFSQIASPQALGLCKIKDVIEWREDAFLFDWQ
jgi:hypothetical protein